MSDDTPPPETKLTRTKEKWAREGRFLTGRIARPDAERLPPGQHLTNDWPVLDLGVTPDIPHDALAPRRLRRDRQSAVLGLGGVHAPAADAGHHRHSLRHHLVALRQCVGRALRRAICSPLAQPKSDAGFVVLHSYDGYTTNLTLEDFAAEDALLVHSWSGKPLEAEHGGPVRLVVPHLYFWKSAKWLQAIEFVSKDAPGYWEVRGYHNRGDPWTEQRYSDSETGLAKKQEQAVRSC